MKGEEIAGTYAASCCKISITLIDPSPVPPTLNDCNGLVLVVTNTRNFPKPFAVKYHGKVFQTAMPAESVGTYVW